MLVTVPLLYVKSIFYIILQNLYPSVRSASAAKKEDMLDLLKFIPSIHHAFFQALKTSTIEESGEKSSNK